MMAALEPIYATWSKQEVKVLMSLYGSREMQNKLRDTYRNQVVYEDLAASLAARGYYKAAAQCRSKIKNMKAKYRRAKAYNEHDKTSGDSTRASCPFYKELDAILQGQPLSPSLRHEEEADVIVLGSKGPGTGLATVTLKVKNDLDPGFQPYEACVSVPPRSSVYTLLLQASANDPNFTFQAEYYGSLSSHLITSINGVAASEEDRTFWRFENKKKFKFDRGVDLIGVFDDDVIVFRFKHYDPPNPDDPPSDCDD
ncbi:myb/SANT-like DNA-binding domain-containing protein 7 [Branchiostoma floridae x Branchiostoma belcheri]